eukprot:COSAG05_NODE_2617_length_2832_cov_3.361142_2_plen_100_part_00
MHGRTRARDAVQEHDPQHPDDNHANPPAAAEHALRRLSHPLRPEDAPEERDHDGGAAPGSLREREANARDSHEAEECRQTCTAPYARSSPRVASIVHYY